MFVFENNNYNVSHSNIYNSNHTDGDRIFNTCLQNIIDNVKIFSAICFYIINYICM